MKKHLLFTLLSASALLLASCSNKKYDVITTSFVSYDAVNNIVGDSLAVSNIIPWGSEMHGFEPNPKQIVAINEAPLFFYTSPELDTWVKDQVKNNNAYALSALYEDHVHEHDELEHEHEDEDHDHDHASLHFWTNPETYLHILEEVLELLIDISPANSALFTTNHENYSESIHQGIEELKSFLAQFSGVPTIYFAGHNAMDAFSAEFGLKIESLSDSYKPDIDFLSEDLIAVIEKIKANDVHYLFVEELSEPRAAKIIQAELAKSNHTLEILELHGYHNITSKQAKEGVSYGELFSNNIKNIKKALRA